MTVSKNFVIKKGLEVGGDTLFANSVTDRVGVGTTNPTSTFTVKGNTALEDLTVSGVSTFSSRVAIGTSNPVSSLTVAGSGTSTSQLFVTGLSTFHNNAFIASDNRLYFGNQTLSISFQSTPSVSNYVETFNHIPLNIVTENLTIGASDGETYANFKVNSSVSLFYDNSKKFETSGLGVTVTGVTSTTYLYATGISTFIDGPVFIGSAVTTGTELQRLQVTGGGYFSSPVGIGITNPSNTLTVAGSGTSTAQLYVVGFSTFVGYSTFRDYVNIEDGLNVLGVSTFVGYSTFRDYVNIEDGLNVLGVSTFVGYSTFRDYVNIEDGLNVLGISTFVGFSTFRDYVNVEDGLNVSGVSTFVGYSTFRDYVNIEDGLNVSGISTLIGNVGVGTTNATSKLTVFGDGRFTGILTASAFSPSSGFIKAADGTDSIYIFDTTGNVAFQGTIGASQINTGSGYKAIDFTSSITPFVNITNGLNVGTSGTIFTTTDSNNVGVGITNPTSKLTVSGNTLITGVTTSSSGFSGNLTGNVTGDLNSSGVNTATTISGTSLTYGTGNLTTGNIVTGVVTTLSGTNLNYSGVTTTTRLNVGTGGTVITTTAGGNVGVGTINPVSRLSVVGGDASVGIDTSQGIILTSANGTRYRLFVENDGTLKTVAV